MKQIKPHCFVEMPSGQSIYPSRLIQRDGTLMWSDACSYNDKFYVPSNVNVEQTIVNTACRLEELNTWISPTMPAWETFDVHLWFYPTLDYHMYGDTVSFSHNLFSSKQLLDKLKPHLLKDEVLCIAEDDLLVYNSGRLTAASVSRDNSDCQLDD